MVFFLFYWFWLGGIRGGSAGLFDVVDITWHRHERLHHCWDSKREDGIWCLLLFLHAVNVAHVFFADQQKPPLSESSGWRGTSSSTIPTSPKLGKQSPFLLGGSFFMVACGFTSRFFFESSWCNGPGMRVLKKLRPLQMSHQNKPCWRARSAAPARQPRNGVEFVRLLRCFVRWNHWKIIWTVRSQQQLEGPRELV